MKRWAWASGWVLGSVFFAAQARAQCSKDTDCKGERVCEAGQCQDPAPLPAPPPPPPAATEGAAPTPGAQPAGPAVAPLAPAAAPAAGETAPVAGAPLAQEPRGFDAEPAPRYHRRSPGLITAGIITTSAAPLVLVIGAIVSTNAYNDCTGSADYYRTVDIDKLSSCQDARETRAVGILAGTLVLLGAGIPMIIYGAKKVPDTEPQARVTPWLSPTSAGLSLRLSL